MYTLGHEEKKGKDVFSFGKGNCSMHGKKRKGSNFRHMLTYSHEIEETMKTFYETLSEKDRRRYAAIEAGARWGMEGKSISVKCWAATLGR